MNRLKTFLYWTFKVSSVLVVSIAMVIFFAWGFDYLKSKKMERELEPLKTAITWDTIQARQFDGQIRLITKFDKNHLKYQLYVDFKDRKKVPNYGTVTIKLYDDDGFQLEEVEIDRENLIGRMGEDGNISGYSAKGSAYIDPDVYKQIARWSFSWVTRD